MSNEAGRKRKITQGGRSENIGCLVVVAVVVALLVIGNYMKHSRAENRSSQMNKFQPLITEFASTSMSNFAVLPQNESAYIRGKVIFLSIGEAYQAADDYDDQLTTMNTSPPILDYMFFKLPEDLKPTSIDQVGTVILLDWRFHRAGTYSDGRVAGWWSLDATLIDKTKNMPLSQEYYRAPDPPQTIGNSYPTHIDEIKARLINYIMSLPRIN